MPGREEEIRSPAVQEILGAVPPWILRWGITLIFAAVLLLFVGAWVIHYPEIVTAQITVTTVNPPVPIVARADGKLTLFVTDNGPVEAETALGVIENPGHLADVLALEETLDDLEPLINRGVPRLEFQPDTNAALGELQFSLSLFLRNYGTYRTFFETPYHQQSIRVLEQQVAYYRDLETQLRRREELVAREVVLAEQKHETDRKLFEKNAISEVERAASESAYLGKKQALETIRANRINNNIELMQQQSAILDLEHQYEEQRRANMIALQNAFNQLKAEVLTWKERYLLTTPIDGRASFFRFWSDNQFVRTGEEVMTIIPIDSRDDLVGKVYLPRTGAGRVQIGQMVRIKFVSYPFNDFGAVEGYVESISLIARDDQYLLEVSLPHGLTTTYKKTLAFKQEMQGTADIVTEDLRLIDRIFNQIRAVFSDTLTA